MTTPAFLSEALREAVAQPKAEATSTAPYTQPPAKQPLSGRAIIFDAANNYTKDSFIDVVIGDPSLNQWVRDVMEKLLITTAGKELLKTLSDMLYDRSTGKYTTKIHLMFIGEARSGVDDECGSINRTTDVPEYWVTLRRYAWMGAPLIIAGTGAGVARCGAQYPPVSAKRAWQIPLCFEDEPVSMGVECTYHELTHIWFIKGGANLARLKQGLPPVAPKFPTGHGTWGNGEFEPDFRDMIKKMIDELNAPHAAALQAWQQMTQGLPP